RPPDRLLFNDPPTTEINTLSLHDALPILEQHVKEYGVDIINLQRADGLKANGKLTEVQLASGGVLKGKTVILSTGARWREVNVRSEEHTSELQSRENLVCRLLLEKKKKKK